MRVCICVSICLLAYLPFTYLSSQTSIQSPNHPSINPPVQASFLPSIHPSTHPPICFFELVPKSLLIWKQMKHEMHIKRTSHFFIDQLQSNPWAVQASLLTSLWHSVLCMPLCLLLRVFSNTLGVLRTYSWHQDPWVSWVIITDLQQIKRCQEM